MSTSTSCIVGYYVVATMKKTLVPSEDSECSKNERHSVNFDDQFCRTCGSPVQASTELESHYQSLYDVINGVETPFTESLSRRNVKWLESNFFALPNDLVGATDRIDIVGLNRFTDNFDADFGGFYESNTHFSQLSKLPDLDRLKKLMQYDKVELKYGLLVIVG